MKRFIIGLAVIASLCSCRQDNFAIVGSLPLFSDAKNLYVLRFDQLDTIAVVPVVDGTFEYKGRIESPRAACVRLDDDSEFWNIILEPGVITLDSMNGEFGGTPYNDLLNEYQKDLTQKQYSMDVESYKEYTRQKSEAFINEHLNDLAGAYILMTMISQLPPEQIKDYVDRSGADFKNSEFVSFMKSRLSVFHMGAAE